MSGICAEPGCPRFATHRGRCPQHAPDRNAPRSPRRDQAAHARFAYAVKKRDGYRCVDCGATDDLRACHVVPLHRGGSDDASNGVTRCARCDMATDRYATPTPGRGGGSAARRRDLTAQSLARDAGRSGGRWGVW
jgi:5-methylcytosine-specific restriction endonuclease McrA